MTKRFHCEFQGCFCTKYRLHCNNLCLHCKHANIWHARKEKPPTDQELSFASSREIAHTPQYEKTYIAIQIFEPRDPEIPVAEEVIYCRDIDILPV